MWLESDEGSVFKTQKKSPTPRSQGSESPRQSNDTLPMVDFAKQVAEQFAQGTNKQEARKAAEGFKLKE